MLTSLGRIAEMKTKNKIVLASGVFDLIHFGHIKFLEEAKKCGGKKAKLVVIIARDDTVKKKKGKHPVLPDDERRVIVESLKPVDAALLGNEPFDIESIIKECKPDMIVFGHDQTLIKPIEKHIRKHKLPIKIIKIKKFGKEAINSSSKIKSRLISQLKNISNLL